MGFKLFAIIIGLMGQALLAYFFFGVVPDFAPDGERWINFVAVSFVMWLWLSFLFRPLVNLKDKTQKQIGGLGLRLSACLFYSIAALLFSIYCIVMMWQPEPHPVTAGIQALVQGILLLIFMLGLFSAGVAKEQVASVYHEEQEKKAGKATVKTTMRSLVMAAEDNPGVPDRIRRRLAELVGETRFLTPSTSDDALMFDDMILASCDRIRFALSDYKMNKATVDSQLEQLARDIARRKKAF